MSEKNDNVENRKARDGKSFTVVRDDTTGRFLPGTTGPGRRKGGTAPGVRWRRAMFNAWNESGLSAPEVQLAWLRGDVITTPDGVELNFRDADMSTAARWLFLQRLFVSMAPKEVAVSGEMDPDAREAALARDRSIAQVMDAIQAELDERARALEGD